MATRFASYDEASVDAKSMNELSEFIREMATDAIVSGNKAHSYYARLANFDQAEWIWKTAKLPQNKMMNELHTSYASSVWAAANGLVTVAHKVHDEQLVKGCQDLKDRVRPWVAQYVALGSSETIPAPELPEIPRTLMDSDADSTDVELSLKDRADGWKKIPKHKRRSKPNPKVVTKLPDVTASTADVEPDVHLDHDVSVGNGIWPVDKNTVTWIYEPGYSAPFHNDKRLSEAQAKEVPLAEITRKEVKAEQFHMMAHLGTDAIRYLRRDHCMPAEAFSSLMDKAPEGVGKVISLTRHEAIEASSKCAVRNAILLYYAGQAEFLLERAGFGSKANFIVIWYKRLMAVPESLDAARAGGVLLAFIKRALKSEEPKTALNKTFYGFKVANLAVWKAGEARSEMLKRSERSVKAYWGDESTAYINEWLKTPDAQYEVRPKYVSLAKKVKTFSETLKAKGKTVENLGKKASASYSAAAESISKEKEEIQEATDGMSWKGKINFGTRRVWNYLGKHLNVAAEKVKAGVEKSRENVLNSRPTGTIKNFFHSLWYTHYDALSVIDTETGEVLYQDVIEPSKFHKAVTFLPKVFSNTARAAIEWIGGALFSGLMTHHPERF
jgi:hypothetical protein